MKNMPETQLWGEMLNVLKDISGYLAKEEVVSQEKAKIDKPPKINEYQDEMTGGPSPSGKEGDVAFSKANIDDVQDGDVTDLDSEEKTFLDKADKEDREDDDEDDEEDDDVEELKSLLKDIRNALVSKSGDTGDISQLVGSEIKKQLPNTMDRMLRKMGYTMTKPDIVKIGVDDGILRKSSSEGKIEELTAEQQSDQVTKIVGDLSKKSWTELGQMRANAGDFKLFPR